MSGCVRHHTLGATLHRGLQDLLWQGLKLDVPGSKVFTFPGSVVASCLVNNTAVSTVQEIQVSLSNSSSCWEVLLHVWPE